MIDGFKNLFKKKTAYQHCFKDSMGNLTTAGQIVINDLAKKCNLYTTTARLDAKGAIDPVHTALQEGKRQTLNYILEVINLTDEHLFKLKERAQNDE